MNNNEIYVIGDVKNSLNTISFIRNENSIQKSNDNSLSFINFGTQSYVCKNNFVVHHNYI